MAGALSNIPQRAQELGQRAHRYYTALEGNDIASKIQNLIMNNSNYLIFAAISLFSTFYAPFPVIVGAAGTLMLLNTDRINQLDGANQFTLALNSIGALGGVLHSVLSTVGLSNPLFFMLPALSGYCITQVGRSLYLDQQ